jgi:ATP-dependent RNA helicase DeaD
LPMICRAGDITKTDIGSIKIHDLETHVEISGAAANRFEAAIGPTGKIEKNVTVTRLNGVPEMPARSPRPPRARDDDFAAAPAREKKTEWPSDDARPREKAKPDYAKKRPFTGGKKRDDRPPRDNAYADRKPAPRDDLPANAKPGVWPYDDVAPAPKSDFDKPKPAAAKYGKPDNASSRSDAGGAKPAFSKDKKPKRDKPDFKPAAKPAKPHRKGPPADAARSGPGPDGGKGGLKRKPKT